MSGYVQGDFDSAKRPSFGAIGGCDFSITNQRGYRYSEGVKNPAAHWGYQPRKKQIKGSYPYSPLTVHPYSKLQGILAYSHKNPGCMKDILPNLALK